MSYGGSDKYYNPNNKLVNDGEVAYADDLNSINYATDASFAQVANDLDALSALLGIGEANAEKWASLGQGLLPDPLEIGTYSSKAYALESKEWASNASGAAIHLANGSTSANPSAKTSATNAAASASAAHTSELNAASSESKASISAANASGSAAEANGYAMEASSSASNAATSESNAALYAAQLPNAATIGANNIPMVNFNGTDWVSVAHTFYAPAKNPTFTGTVVLPATTSIGSVSSTELGYVDGVTSAIQTQLNSKAPIASPSLTGTVTVSAAQPALKFVDTSTNAPDYKILVDVDKFYVQRDYESDGSFSTAFYFDGADSSMYVNASKVWTAGNDGAGSGLDADLLDGMQPTAVPAAQKIVQSNTDGLIDPEWLGIDVARELREISLDLNPTLDLNFGEQSYRHYDGSSLISHALTPFVTFSRITTATYIDVFGTLKTAAIDTPRIDYDPETGECLGILLEEQRTNLLTYSEDFSNAVWYKATLTLTSGQDSPDDGTNAYKLTENTGTGTHQLYEPYTATANKTYTTSVFVKAGERTSINLCGPGSRVNAFFNLNTLEIAKATNVIDAGIIQLKNGWFRCYVTGVADGVTSNYAILRLVDETGSQNYTGDGTSGLYAFGFMLEEGEFWTSYIKTEASQVTRGKDNATVETLTNCIQDEEFSVLWEGNFISKSTTGITQRLFNLTDTALTNSFRPYRSQTTNKILTYVASSGGTASITSELSFANEMFRVLFSQKLYERIAASCGGETTRYTETLNTPLSFDKLMIGSYSALGMSGHIKRIALFPRVISDEQMSELSN